MEGLAVRGAPAVAVAAGPAGRRRFELWAGAYPVRHDEELHYDLLPCATPDDGSIPVDVWWEGPFGATGAAVDVVFADGSRLSESGARDQHGIPLDAAAQAASLTMRPDQWNRRTADLASVAGRTAVRIEIVVEAPEGIALQIGVGTVGIRRTPPEPASPLDRVDSLRGTNSDADYSRGNTVPAVALPNGFALTIPMTDPGDAGWPFRYGDPADDLRFAGLRVGHTPTPWLGDYGTLDVVPSSGGGGEDSAPRDSVRIAPHRLRMRLRSGIDVDVVPTHAGSLHRYRFGKARAGGAGARVVDLQVPGAGLLSVEGEADGQQAIVVVGHSDVTSPLLVGSPRVHLAVRVTGATGIEALAATRLRLLVDRPADEVSLEVATSLLGPAQALAGLSRRPFDAVEAQARSAWEEILGLVSIAGGTTDQQATLYSSLARIFLYPGVASERGADGVERFADVASSALVGGAAESAAMRIHEGRLSVGNGFWDTYRTVWPAYALLAPERSAELLDGFLAHARTSGWMPRWSAPGAVDIMVGTSSDIVFADALARGVPLPDSADALRTALRNATVPSPYAAAGRRGLATAVFDGYTSDDVPESVAWTIENAINDFGTLSMIERRLAAGEAMFDGVELGALRQYFAARAGAHRRLFDPEAGLFRARDRAGRFEEPFDPSRWGGGYTETDAWGMAFSSVHDGPGTARLHGGAAALEARLDEYFGTIEPFDPAFVGTYGRRIHEMTEARAIRMGRFALSNQPAHHAPYMYAFTPSPWKTSAITRAALRRQFQGSEIGQGYPGDEDNGEMSAWYLFSALGFYPLQVGTPWYVLTAPLFDAAEVVVSGGRLRIVCEGNLPGNDYIRSVSLDGRPLESVFLAHDELARGGELRFVLGDRPVDWATTIPGEIHLMSDRIAADVGDALGTRLHPIDDAHLVLSDDDSTRSLAVAQGDEVMWAAEAPLNAAFYTVTCADHPGDVPSTWQVEASGDGVEWRAIGNGRAAFQWSRQTVPFALQPHERFRFLRLAIVEGSGRIAQIEVFSDLPGS